jgi:hypothetical protein
MAYYGHLSLRRKTWRILAEYFMARSYRLEALTRTKSKTDSFSATKKKNQSSEGDELGVFTGHARAMRGALFVLA